MSDTAEFPITFASGGQRLLGIVTPADGTVGVVIVVGGPQYRVGAHRQFVHLARALAAAGHPVLRFDIRGMGDSEGALRDFEGAAPDVGAAIAAFCGAVPGVQRVVLWGLCDGASAALLYLHGQPSGIDPRVAGLALLNPWVRSAASLARTHVKHYYLQRLRQGEFWRKLLKGGVAVSALSGLVGNVRAAFGGASAQSAATDALAPFQQRMAEAWARFDGAVLLLLCDDDLTAREFAEFTVASAPWRHAFARRPPQRVHVAGADHTCSQPAAQAAVEQATARWLASIGA